MKVSAISFGNQHLTQNRETQENEALAKLWKYWKTTGDFRPAKINFYDDCPPVISMIGEKPKTKSKFGNENYKNTSFFRKFIKKIFNLISK